MNARKNARKKSHFDSCLTCVPLALTFFFDEKKFSFFTVFRTKKKKITRFPAKFLFFQGKTWDWGEKK